MDFHPLNLFSENVENDLRRIQEAGKATCVSITFTVLCEDEQTIELCSPETPDHHTSNEANHDIVEPGLDTLSSPLPSSGDKPANSLLEKGHLIYPIGSCTKPVLFVAYIRFIKLYGEKYHISWDTPACPLLNEWLAKVKGGHTNSIRLKRYPTIIELFQHMNGFADMNLALFAPDGSFIMPAEKVLSRAARYTNARYGDAHRGGDPEYSNINYIFLGLLLQLIMGKSLAEALQELVFGPFKMGETSLVRNDLAQDKFVNGFQISANGSRIPVKRSQTPNNVAHAAAMGLWSSASDMTKFLLEITKALEHDSDLLTFDEHKDGKLMHIICHKAGYVDGSSSVIVLIPEFRACLTILANTTGPLDVAHHMQRYLLQKLLKLSPDVDTVTEAINEGIRLSTGLSTLQSESSPQLAQHWSPAGDLSGTYEHEEHKQLITIYDDGTAEFSYDDGTAGRSSRMPVVHVSNNKIRILTLRNGCLSIERWAQWRDVEFSVHKDENSRSLLRDNDKRSYVAIR